MGFFDAISGRAKDLSDQHKLLGGCREGRSLPDVTSNPATCAVDLAFPQRPSLPGRRGKRTRTGSRTEIPKNFREPAPFQRQRKDVKRIFFARVDLVDTQTNPRQSQGFVVTCSFGSIPGGYCLITIPACTGMSGTKTSSPVTLTSAMVAGTILSDTRASPDSCPVTIGEEAVE